jgi:hypothetical protein
VDAFVGLAERLEEAVSEFSGDPDARVLDLDDESPTLFSLLTVALQRSLFALIDSSVFLF